MTRAGNNCVIQSALEEHSIHIGASIADDIELAFNVSNQYLFSINFHINHLAYGNIACFGGFHKSRSLSCASITAEKSTCFEIFSVVTLEHHLSSKIKLDKLNL